MPYKCNYFFILFIALFFTLSLTSCGSENVGGGNSGDNQTPPTNIAATVTFNSNDGEGSMEPISTFVGETITLPTNKFTKYNLYFNGWAQDKNATTPVYNDNSSLLVDKSEIILFAIWSQIKPVTATIVFDPNGGTGSILNITGNLGSKIKLPENTFIAPINKTFGGWYIESEVKVYSPNDEYEILADVTFKAQWKQIDASITFDPNGGTGTTAEINTHVGATITLTKNSFTRENYAFTGWNTQANGSGTTYIDEAKYTASTGATTLYAQWSDNRASITFDPNGGTGTMAEINTHVGATITLTKNSFTRENYAFTGWNTQANGSGTTYIDEAKYAASTGATTLYAQWSDNRATITFDPNGGTGSMSEINTHVGLTITLTANTFSQNGFIFAGWNTQTNGSGNHYKNNETLKVTASATLYAQWAPTTYTMSDHDDPNFKIFYIVNSAHLVQLANIIKNNAGATFAGKTILIMNDIDMKNIAFEGLRREYSKPTEYFQGTFDGNNCTISNMSINLPSDKFIGLIGVVGENGIVQNLTLINSVIYGKSYVGGVVGFNHDNGTIQNINNNAQVTSSSPNNSYVGGVVGVNRATVKNITNSGSVTGSGDYSSIGGVVGQSEGKVSYAYNNASVTGSGTGSSIGGVVGFSTLRTTTNSSNSGSVTGSGGTYAAHIGGVVGRFDQGTISNVSNSGSVTSTTTGDNVGGVVGWWPTYSGMPHGNVTNVYNIGEIISTSTDVGGVVGNPENKTVVKGFFLKVIGGTNSHLNDTDKGNGKGKNVDEFTTEALSFPTDTWENKTFTGSNIINGVETRAVIIGLDF